MADFGNFGAICSDHLLRVHDEMRDKKTAAGENQESDLMKDISGICNEIQFCLT